MSEIDLHIRCQRCGAQMELRDPLTVETWKPDQFWVCPVCGRHFWTTYPPPAREKAKPAAPPPAAAPAAPPPASPAPPVAPAAS
jgi:transposase-like protein